MAYLFIYLLFYFYTFRRAHTRWKKVTDLVIKPFIKRVRVANQVSNPWLNKNYIQFIITPSHPSIDSVLNTMLVCMCICIGVRATHLGVLVFFFSFLFESGNAGASITLHNCSTHIELDPQCNTNDLFDITVEMFCFDIE